MLFHSASIVAALVAALLVETSPFFNSRREPLIALAARHALPTISMRSKP
jgi:hypothetical protein